MSNLLDVKGNGGFVSEHDGGMWSRCEEGTRLSISHKVMDRTVSSSGYMKIFIYI